MLRKKKSVKLNMFPGTWPVNPLMDLQTWPISNLNFSDFIHPTQSTAKNLMGCAIDAFNFLKIISPELGRFMSNMATQKQTGTTIVAMKPLLEQYYKENPHIIHQDETLYFCNFPFYDRADISSLGYYLNEKLGINHATIVSFDAHSTKDGVNTKIGHSIVVSKDSIGNLCIIEPQLGCTIEIFHETYFTNWANAARIGTGADSVTFLTIHLLGKSQFHIENADRINHQIPKKTLRSWPITQEMVTEWSVLNPEKPRNEAMDCYYNVFGFLNMIPRDILEHLSATANIDGAYNATGQPICQEDLDDRFLNIMRDYHTDKYDQYFTYTITKFELSIPTVDEYRLIDLNVDIFVEYLRQNLKTGLGTIAWLYRNQTIGHCIIIYRINDEFYIIDPQQNRIRILDTWTRWFTRHRFTHVSIIEQLPSGKRALVDDSRLPQSSSLISLSSSRSKFARRPRVTVKKQIKQHIASRSRSRPSPSPSPSPLRNIYPFQNISPVSVSSPYTSPQVRAAKFVSRRNTRQKNNSRSGINMSTNNETQSSSNSKNQRSLQLRLKRRSKIQEKRRKQKAKRRTQKRRK